jgi:hypothetical protein
MIAITGNIRSLALGVVGLMAAVASGWSGQAQANPIIQSMYFPPRVDIRFTHTDGSPVTELLGSFTTTQAPFSSVTSSGGGSASAGSPGILESNTSASIGAQPFFLTVAGAGSATAKFGASITAVFTNTGPTTENYTLIGDYYVNTQVRANPAIGEAMAYGWTDGAEGSAPCMSCVFPPVIELGEIETQSHVCSQTSTDPYDYACNAFFDFNPFQNSFSLAPGQDATIMMVLDFNLAVSAAPEPSALGVMAPGLLALGLLYRGRSRR